jgi:hypothetical protein
MKLGRDFDLKKFTGSFSRVADFSAWYPSGKAAEDAAADEDARGSTQVLHYMRLACHLACECLDTRGTQSSTARGPPRRRWVGGIQQQLHLRRAVPARLALGFPPAACCLATTLGDAPSPAAGNKTF